MVDKAGMECRHLYKNSNSSHVLLNPLKFSTLFFFLVCLIGWLVFFKSFSRHLWCLSTHVKD